LSHTPFWQQATEVVDQLRSLVYDVACAASLDAYAESAREEVLRACQTIREESSQEPATLERARQVLAAYVYFVDAVETYLQCAPQ
jgi:hypothetical protein